MFAARKGGTIVTCASTSGYMHQYDNRYLWMNLKRIIGSHFANYRESWEANRLIAKGMIHPTLSRTYSLDEVGQAALDVHQNAHQGKVGVLCLAPEEGLGVRDEEMRAKHLDEINRVPRASDPVPRTAPATPRWQRHRRRTTGVAPARRASRAVRLAPWRDWRDATRPGGTNR